MNAIKNRRSKPMYAALAAAVLAVVVMPLAVAGAQNGGPVATSSAGKVTKQLKGLQKRIAQLEGRGGGATPAGPASGDLAGNYPSPTIRPNAVGSPQVAQDALTVEDIGENAVSTGEIADGGVEAIDLRQDSVGASELKGVTYAVGAGKGVADDSSGIATVTCPDGTMLIAGGHAWSQDEKGTSIIGSTPSEANPNTTWVVHGRADDSSNTLFAWATCIQA